MAADSPANYLRLLSQPTDPSGLTGYAVKRNSSPAVPAARGADLGLTAALGGFNNLDWTLVPRVLTLQAVSPLPAGASPLTVTASLAPDPASGRQPIALAYFSDVSGASPALSATLTAGAKKQVNLVVLTQGLPGTNRLSTPTLSLRVTYPGYTGTFLSYQVPISVWDGSGAGP